MALTTRRQFLQQAAFAGAALSRGPMRAFARARRTLEATEQNAAPTDAAAIRKLVSQISRRVITPETPDYESARLVFNRVFDPRPAPIVRCADAPDVVRAVEFAPNQNLPLAVRGGGHNRLGIGVCDGGVIIDLSAMNRVEVDAGKRVARAEAGALVWGRGWRHAALRIGDNDGWLPDGRNCWPDPGRRRGSADVEVRRCVRQLGISATCNRGWKANRGQSELQSRSFLGDSRWRRKFRSGNGARVPAPSTNRRSGGNAHLPAWTNGGALRGLGRIRRGGAG